MQKYSAKWVKQQAQEKGASWLVNHDCSICGVDVGYIINGDYVAFRSGCGCSWAPDRESSFEEISEWLQMQRSDEIRDGIMSKLS